MNCNVPQVAFGPGPCSENSHALPELVCGILTFILIHPSNVAPSQTDNSIMRCLIVMAVQLATLVLHSKLQALRCSHRLQIVTEEDQISKIMPQVYICNSHPLTHTLCPTPAPASLFFKHANALEHLNNMSGHCILRKLFPTLVFQVSLCLKKSQMPQYSLHKIAFNSFQLKTLYMPHLEWQVV